jgi:SAM-dependent methyltransferase
MVDEAAQALLADARSFWRTRVLLTMVELELFARISERPRSVDDLVEEIGADPRGMRILLDAATGQGWLEKAEERYRLAGSMRAYLSPEGEQCVLPMLEHMAKLWHDWTRLSEIAAPRTQPAWRHDHGRTRSFIGAMHVVSKGRAPELVSAVGPSSERSLLDVGGASGTFTMEFLREVPGMKATLFDLPEVVELARERLDREGLGERVRLVGGDYRHDPMPDGPYELALLSAIIHQNDRRENEELYAKIHEVLAPGGRLIIRDHVLEPDRTAPADGALFAVNMLVATEGGDCYTFDEIRSSLEAAGFRQVRMLQRDERMSGLVEATK